MKRVLMTTGLWLVGLGTMWGCSGDNNPPPIPDAGSTAVPSASTTVSLTASATASAPAKAEPLCKPVERKVWSDVINARTGLTAQQLEGGTVAIGVAVGNRPHRLIFDDKGQGKLERLALAEGHALAKSPRIEEAERHLQRVTPTADSGGFADYRDKRSDNTRRIACGPLGTAKPFLVFDGEALLDTDDSGRGKATPTPASSAKTPAAANATGSTAASASGAPPVVGSAPVAAGSAGAPSASTPPPAPPAPAPPPAPDKPLVELRDCRTFSDGAGKDVWAVGSELRGKRDGEDTNWSMRFFVAPDRGRGARVELYRVPLGKSPKKLHTLEAPVAHALPDGSFVLTGRYRGELLSWLLDDKKQTQGAMKRYRGGYPTMPRLASLADFTWLLTSQQTKVDAWQLRGLRFGASPALADSLAQVPAAADAKVAAEPMVAKAQGGNWLSYHTAGRRDGALALVPVDADLKPLAAPFTISAEGEHVYESVLVSSGEQLIAVYIVSRPKSAPQLVSVQLSCTPPQPG